MNPELIAHVAEAIRDVPYVGHGEPPSCEDMAVAAIQAAALHPAFHGEASRVAWEEGAEAGWQSTGEGWNGEYAEGTHDGTKTFRSAGNDLANPYETEA